MEDIQDMEIITMALRITMDLEVVVRRHRPRQELEGMEGALKLKVKVKHCHSD